MASADEGPVPAAVRPIAVTMGEPAGIGGELTLRSWLDRRHQGPVFVALDDPDRLSRLSAALGWSVPIETVVDPAEALTVFGEALPVLPIPLGGKAVPGKPDPATAPAVLASIERAVALCLKGAVAGLVTQPIQKSVLYSAGFRHPGHTEFVAALSRAERAPVMMLAGPALRTVPATIHIPLAAVPAALTAPGLTQTLQTVADALIRDFAIPRPRIAVAGLNPHAGEAGSLGMEDIQIVAPAIEAAAAACPEAIFDGPLPADTMFHPEARARYDTAVAMYHDQALIPVKTLDFDRTVNLTLGLPIVRTSPDHGTALDLAGSGRARPDSFLAALDLAGHIAANRARTRQ